jgi:2-methylcitrate dehydratase PrpD
LTTAEPDEGAGALLIDHALGLGWNAISQAAKSAAKTFLHDSLCVGVAGAKAPNADAILSVAQTWGSGGACSVLGRPGVYMPAASAAYVNAFQIHCQEFDCVHERAVLHPMATLTAAVRAEAERSGPYSGEALIAAIVVGVDIAVALGLAPTTPLRFFRPATAGIFGSVAALCRLRGLDRTTALDAFGYALAFSSGTMQAHVEGKPALPVQVAHAARSALDAVDLAVAGLKGPHRSIDGPFGYLTLFEVSYDLEPILRDLATVRRITEVSWKPFPTGRAAQGGLVALQTLVDAHGVTAANLESLVFTAPPLIKRLVGRRPHAGMDVAYARLCLPYLASVALHRGEVGLADFSHERLNDSAILTLAEKISVAEDGSTDPAAFTPLLAAARTVGGGRADVTIDAMLGSPQNPLTDAQHMEKARRCLAHAGLEAAHLPLADAIASLELAADVAAALSVSAPEVRASAVD